jgi:hypothetical protein
MRPFLAQFSEPVWSGHLPSWADFITTTPVFRFSVDTPILTQQKAYQTIRGEGGATDPGCNPRSWKIRA